MASSDEKEDGYQINADSLTLAICNQTGAKKHEVFIDEFTKTAGSNKGENFTCILYAVEVKAYVREKLKTFNYMIKCLPVNLNRAKFLLDMNGFQKECLIYGELMADYQRLRTKANLNPLPVPTCYLADNDNGVIIMENLKARDFTMMNKLAGEEMTMDLATNVLKVAAAFHATGYHCLQEKQGGVKKFLEDVPELVFNGWLAFKAPEDKAKHDAIHIQNYLNIKAIIDACAEGDDAYLKDKFLMIDEEAQRKMDDSLDKKESGFQTIIHNDMHMNNVMLKKDETVEEVFLLDLQMIKYTRPTVDLAYFLGSSTTPKFRAANLRKCLEMYHSSLVDELEQFGYDKDLYTLDQLMADFKDCWMFGYFINCMHVQMESIDFETDEFNMEDFLDESKQEDVMKRWGEMVVKRAKANKPFVEKLISIVKETVEGIDRIL